MDDETMQTILLRIMPQKYVNDMRDKLTEGKHKNDNHGFEQELFDEVSTRKMDEDSRETCGDIFQALRRRHQGGIRGSRSVVRRMAVQHLRYRPQARQEPKQEPRARSKRRRATTYVDKASTTRTGRRQRQQREGKRDTPCKALLDVWRSSLSARLPASPSWQRQLLYKHCMVFVEARNVPRTHDDGTVKLLAAETLERQRQRKERQRRQRQRQE